MAINTALVSRQLHILISKRSIAAITAHKDDFKREIQGIARQWKTETKRLLSVPYSKGQINQSLYPKLRGGDLMRSLGYRVQESNFLITAKRTQAQFTVTPIWRPVLNKKGDDYGDLLNSADRWETSTFYGWKDRTHEALRRRILKGNL